MDPLPNPERDWERAGQLRSFDPAEIERRVGKWSGDAELLSGGLANLNIRLGADRVLRIHARDPETVLKEAALLGRGWETFRVPALLDRGEDFLLLEYVPHLQLAGTAEHGQATGRALAEIHAAAYQQAGFLGPDLAVAAPFSDFVAALHAHLRSHAGTLAAAGLSESVLATFAAQETQLRAAAGTPVLLHGDFKVSNLHWTAAGKLLLLDWEFAYAGSRLMDLGQLFRWHPPAPFADAFAAGYLAHGGTLPDGWARWAGLLDLTNLAGLLAGAAPGSTRARDVVARIHHTLQRPGGIPRV